MVCSLVEAYRSLLLGFPLLLLVLVIAGRFNPWHYTGCEKNRTTESRYNFKWRHFFLVWTGELRIHVSYMYTVFSFVVCLPLVARQANLWSYLRSWWLGNALPKQAASPVRLSEVVAIKHNTGITSESCSWLLCSYRSREYFDVQLHLRTWVLDLLMKGKLDL